MCSIFLSKTYLHRVIDSLDPDGPPRMELLLKAERGIFRRLGRLGVFSSSFNPPTTAHVMMVEKTQKTCALDEVLLLLSKRNVDKALCGASFEDRLSMVICFAIQHSTLSVGIATHALLLDQAEALRNRYPHGTEISFIIGFDTFLRVFDPRYYTDLHEELRRLFASVNLIVANRGTHDVEEIQELLNLPANRPYTDRVSFIHLDPFYASLSSTEVRRHVASGETIEGLVPPGVTDYILECGLYQNEG